MPINGNDDFDYEDKNNDELRQGKIWGDEFELNVNADERLISRWENDIEELMPEDWEQHMGGPDNEELESSLIDLSDWEEDLSSERTNFEFDENKDQDEESEYKEEEMDNYEEFATIAQRCIDLKREIYFLREELALQTEMILENMSIDEKIEFEGYRFKSCISTKYNFSDEVDVLKEKLKNMKSAEIECGKASVVAEKRYIKISRLLSNIRREYPRASYVWIKNEEEFLKKEADSGTPIKEIAARLKRQPSAVREKIASLKEIDAGKQL